MRERELRRLSLSLGEQLQRHGMKVTCAESCTGGAVAAAITDVAGSSQWFDMGFVTYSNGAKTKLLGVPETSLHEQGAVSEAVVEAMASGALRKADADLAVSISGIAGPTGGTTGKPVGTVWFGWAKTGQKTLCLCRQFDGDRTKVREQSVIEALRGLLSLLDPAQSI